MYIVSVLPLTKTSNTEPLTYFSSTEFEAGTLIKVPLRNRDVKALVLKSSPAEASKMDLRQSNFALKKINASLNKNGGKIFATKSFMRAVEKFAEYEAQPFASTLGALFPNILFEAKRKVIPEDPRCSLENDTLAFQGSTEERFSSYRSLIRETFARKKSIFVLVPTVSDTRIAVEELSKGIENFTAVFSGNLKKKDVEKALKVVDDPSHPALIIATPTFLNTLRSDTETLILDRENSRAYKTISRPNLDFRIFAKILAREYCTRVIYGGDLLSVDTVNRLRQNEVNEWGHLKMRGSSTTPTEIISMLKTETDEPFKIFSDSLRSEIENITQNRKRIFLYGARKGLSPTTICADCETVVSCDVCTAPLTLYNNKAKPYFLCHKCGEKKAAKDQCKHCEGWRLITLGIGIEAIEREIQKIAPYSRLLTLDKDTAKTSKMAERIIKEFLETPGAILVGTEMALHYLNKPIEISAVVSADSLFGIPDFRMNEKVMALLLKIRSLASEKTIFQTRDPENKIFEFARDGNLLSFFEREISERQRFNFPPFSLFIKIAWEGSPARAERDAETIKQIFGEEIEVFRVINGVRLSRYHGLIKIGDLNQWPRVDLVERLTSLPPQFSVYVDPDSLL